MASTGIPGYESIIIFGAFAPAKIPNGLVAKLHQDMVRALSKTEIKEKFFNAGMEVVGSTPSALAVKVNAEMDSLRKVIKETGIRED